MSKKSETYYIEGEFPVIGYMLECPHCKRKIIVDTALIGTNHNIGVFATCADCLQIRPEFATSHPEIVEQIDKWRKGDEEKISDKKCEPS